MSSVSSTTTTRSASRTTRSTTTGRRKKQSLHEQETVRKIYRDDMSSGSESGESLHSDSDYHTPDSGGKKKTHPQNRRKHAKTQKTHTKQRRKNKKHRRNRNRNRNRKKKNPQT